MYLIVAGGTEASKSMFLCNDARAGKVGDGVYTSAS